MISDQSEDSEVVNAVTAAMREADRVFEKVGGSTRHHVRDCLLPVLNRNGWRVVPASAVAEPPQPSPAPPGNDWEPIDTAPRIEHGDAPIDVLVCGPTLGVYRGRVANYPSGYLFAGVAHINGNLAEDGTITHWMPLPAPPPSSDRGTR